MSEHRFAFDKRANAGNVCMRSCIKGGGAFLNQHYTLHSVIRFDYTRCVHAHLCQLFKELHTRRCLKGFDLLLIIIEQEWPCLSMQCVCNINDLDKPNESM